MNNSAAILRALIVYAVCVPLAIIVGVSSVSLINSPNYSSFGEFGVLALILSAPILLRWHHPLLVLSWNLPMTMFFLPGNPGLYLPMMMVSLGISVLQRMVSKDKHFIPAPQITWPLLCLALVALGTAKLTGGIGLHMLGNAVMGGKKYVGLLAGILGYFALTARRIPPHQAGLYLALFLLPPCASIIGELVAIIPRSFYFLFWLFPADAYAMGGSAGLMRFAGLATLATTLYAYMLARYGISGIFRAGKPWRMVALIVFVALGFFGGFRSSLINGALIFSIIFYLEGLQRTRLFPILVFFGLLSAVICLPMARHLPNAFQRVLSFLPVDIDPDVRAGAEGSLQWRLDMWKALLPQVPPHLLLGKGYAITQEDAQLMGGDSAFHSIDPAQQGLALSGDYHSGPLSVIIPFGIWGVIAFLWFIVAGIWALNHNRLYGDPAFQTYNTYLFAAFLTKVISFFFIFGALAGDIQGFAGLLGLSISLNGGIRRAAREPAATTTGPSARIPARPRLQASFQR